jgi:pyruvate/2-oxoglutarate/acetoin dehydrogenase E1 component
MVTEELFGELLAAPMRISAADTPVPFSPVLEEAIAPTVVKIVDNVTGMTSASHRGQR